MFRYPCFAIKSYGKEKRYLCPPPHFLISGSEWKNDQNHFSQLDYNVLPQMQHRPTKVIGSSKIQETNSNVYRKIRDKDELKNDLVEANSASKYYCVIEIAGVDLQDSGFVELNDNMNGYATRVFIPDSKEDCQSILLNSLNSFSFSVTLLSSNFETPICSFNSGYIKLKSKALSYSKQAINSINDDMCLVSGATISLYSRVHAHKSNTRFLYTSGEKFVAHPLYWDSFAIHKVSEHSQEADFDSIDGPIFYGDYVKIVSTKTNISLPTAQILPVENTVNFEAKIVQYLSRCSFRFRYNPSKFLCISGQKDVVAEESLKQTSPSSSSVQNGKKANNVVDNGVREEAIWAITKIGVELFCFAELVKPIFVVSPFPKVEMISLQGPASNSTLKIIGNNLSPMLSVWLGTAFCITYFQTQDSLLAILPDLHSLA
ncbi:MAG: hypothetical protein MHPSP_000796 [Paramarteilia canceri]